MLQTANANLYNPLVPKAHICEPKKSTIFFTNQKSVMASLRIFILCTLGTNGLNSRVFLAELGTFGIF